MSPSRTQRMTWIIAATATVLVCAAVYASVSDPKTEKVSPEPLTALTEPPGNECGALLATGDLLLLSKDEGGACWADAPEAAGIQPTRGRPKLGYCQCGCGSRCTTDADCGGDPCRAFVTCC